jgi:hypothetical protein
MLPPIPLHTYNPISKLTIKQFMCVLPHFHTPKVTLCTLKKCLLRFTDCLSVIFLMWYCNLSIFSNAKKKLHISINLSTSYKLHNFLCVKIFKHSNHMTCGINVHTLGSNIWQILVFYENKSYFIGILKILDPFINHMTITLKGLISNIKI